MLNNTRYTTNVLSALYVFYYTRNDGAYITIYISEFRYQSVIMCSVCSNIRYSMHTRVRSATDTFCCDANNRNIPILNLLHIVASPTTALHGCAALGFNESLYACFRLSPQFATQVSHQFAKSSRLFS